MEREFHRPVLLRETLAALACRPGGTWVDGTVGGGGHAEAILHASSPDGRLLGCDRDTEAVEAARSRLAPFGPRAILVHADHARIPALLDEIGARGADGILLDLGVSSLQFDEPRRGFSFREDGPLDMRMDQTQTTTAAVLVNTLSEREIASILACFGEEPGAARIARAIVRERERGPITSTGRLAEIVARAAGASPARRDRARPRRSPRIHPATRSFQALRIAVNHELEGLGHLLEDSAGRLRGGGRLAVISFHSLEDRIVKRTFRSLARRCVCPRDLPVCACGRPDLVRLVTTRPIRPTEEEIRRNPRSRSARLRVVERLDQPSGGGPEESR